MAQKFRSPGGLSTVSFPQTHDEDRRAGRTSGHVSGAERDQRPEWKTGRLVDVYRDGEHRLGRHKVPGRRELTYEVIHKDISRIICKVAIKYVFGAA